MKIYHCMGTCCDIGKALLILPADAGAQPLLLQTQEGPLTIVSIGSHEFNGYARDGQAETRCEIVIENGTKVAKRAYLVCTKECGWQAAGAEAPTTSPSSDNVQQLHPPRAARA